ncbi:MAG: hypothetical protein K1X89_11975, partial [Myxococcaceae bacterium]|nr:hypothetical protein [Myxococcaceae bacterium]
GGSSGGGAAGGSGGGTGGGVGGGSGGGAGGSGGGLVGATSLALSGATSFLVDTCTPGFAQGRQGGVSAALAAGTPIALDAGALLPVYSDPQCTAGAPVLVKSDGGAEYFVRARDAGTFQLGAASSGLQGASASLTASYPAAVGLGFANLKTQVRAGDCEVFTLELRDGTNKPTRANAPTDAGVVVVAGNGGLYSDFFCRTPLTSSFTIGQGQAGRLLSFKGVTGQVNALQASAAVGLDAGQTVDVLPLVRRGTCSLGTMATGVDCTISPPHQDLTQTFLVFQSLNDSSNSAVADTRCFLKDETTVHCDRAQAGTATTVVWQTAEHRTFEVDRVNFACDAGQPTSVPLPMRNTPPSSSFVLSSLSNNGGAVNNDDFVGLTLNSGNLGVGFVSNCAHPTNVHAQVVGISTIAVSRLQTTIDAGVRSLAMTFPAAQQPALLSTYRPLTPDGNVTMCDMALMGDATSATGAILDRGAGNTACGANYGVAAVNAERLDFLDAGTVTRLLGLMGGATKSQVITTPALDTTRTLYFTPSQGPAGQGMGQVDDQTQPPYVGTASAAFTPLLDGGVISTSLRVDRGRGAGNAGWIIQSVELAP